MSELKHFSADLLLSPIELLPANLGSVAMPEKLREQYHLALTSSLPGSTIIEGQLVFAELSGPGSSTTVEVE